MNNKHYKALFSRTNAGEAVQPPGTVLFYPDNPSWNDFGYQVRAKLRVRASDGRPPLLLAAFVIALEDGSGSPVARSFATWVRDLASAGSSLFSAPDDANEPKFLTLLSDDSTYRRLAEWSSSMEERWAILLAANDINQARLQQTIPRAQIENVTSTDAFTLGVMRSSSAYRAYTKGPRYISRQIIPWIEDARSEFRTTTRLRGFDSPHDVKFRFGGALLVSDRAHVLIGKNGTGKSQLLNQILGAFALQADNSGSEVFLDRPNVTFDKGAVSDRPIPNAVLVFSADDDAPFPRQTRLDTALDYSYFSLSATPSLEFTELARHSLGRALRDLLRDDALLKGRTRFQIFRDVVSPVLRLSVLHLPIKRGAKRVMGVVTDSSGHSWLPLNRVPTGEQETLYLAAALDTDRDVGLLDSDGHEFPPSSGQRVYLRFAAQALSVIAQGSLIILDEPETHLHPNFVSEFMTLLHQVLEATNSIAIVATHSPYVVREVPTACVHLVQRTRNSPQITGVHLRTLGASVSSISDAVFGDPSAKKFHQIIAKQLANRAAYIADTEERQITWLIETFGEELNTEMLSSIRFLLSKNPSDRQDSLEGHNDEGD